MMHAPPGSPAILVPTIPTTTTSEMGGVREIWHQKIWLVRAVVACVDTALEEICWQSGQTASLLYTTAPTALCKHRVIPKMMHGWLGSFGASPISHNKPHTPHASLAFMLRTKKNATNASGHAAKPWHWNCCTPMNYCLCIIRALFLQELNS
jgi:hypothetical protein